MRSNPKLLLLLLPVMAGVASPWLLGSIPVLQVTNTTGDQETVVFRASFARFSLSYIHSIYLQPVTEDFEAGEGEEMILRGVRTKSAAVAQYYGFEDGREFYPVNRKMKSFVLRVGISQPQLLQCGEEKVDLRALGEKGDRLEFKVKRISRIGIWLPAAYSRIHPPPKLKAGPTPIENGKTVGTGFKPAPTPAAMV